PLVKLRQVGGHGDQAPCRCDFPAARQVCQPVLGRLLYKEYPVWVKERLDDHRLHFGLSHCGKGASELAWTPDQYRLKPEPGRCGGQTKRSSTKGPLYGLVVAVVPRAAMRRRFGMSSRSSWTRLPPISASIIDRPVTFPPGRAKLSITPNCRGAPCGAMTIGIVRVAAIAADTATA